MWCEELPDVPGPDLPDVGGEEGECVPPVLLLAEEVRPLDEVNQPLPGHRLLALLQYSVQSQFSLLSYLSFGTRVKI